MSLYMFRLQEAEETAHQSRPHAARQSHRLWALLHRGREVFFLSRYFRKARSYFRLTVHTCTFRSHLEASLRCRLRERSRGGISTGIGVQNEAVGT
jgi:hypothetical protein